MAMVRFVVPGRPRGKSVIRTGGGTFFVAGETREEMETVRIIANRAMNGAVPFDDAVELRLCAYFAVPRSWSRVKQARALAAIIRPTVKPDWDNIGKLCDALKGVVWRDDALVTDVHLWKRYADQPRVVIEITEIEASNVSE